MAPQRLQSLENEKFDNFSKNIRFPTDWAAFSVRIMTFLKVIGSAENEAAAKFEIFPRFDHPVVEKLYFVIKNGKNPKFWKKFWKETISYVKLVAESEFTVYLVPTSWGVDIFEKKQF